MYRNDYRYQFTCMSITRFLSMKDQLFSDCMGICLHRIKDIRLLYDEEPFGISNQLILILLVLNSNRMVMLLQHE